MFDKLGQLADEKGIPFRNVLRTWCYLDDIDRDYAEFNLSRNAFFEREAIQRLPASTGIRSGLHPPGTLCSTDMYALVNPEGTHIEIMHTPTLNEAAEYGSSFSRGMKLCLPEKTVLFVSGTASVDEEGATVHVNDCRKQIERMLLNIRELLAPHDADFADVKHGITYLKSAKDLTLFLEIVAEWGLASMPNSIVEAGVCRPELLCEMEVIAVLPK
jgi:enamine deaminase RidA (YjgF/YER057c/UK114 family)